MIRICVMVYWRWYLGKFNYKCKGKVQLKEAMYRYIVLSHIQMELKNNGRLRLYLTNEDQLCHQLSKRDRLLKHSFGLLFYWILKSECLLDALIAQGSVTAHHNPEQLESAHRIQWQCCQQLSELPSVPYSPCGTGEESTSGQCHSQSLSESGHCLRRSNNWLPRWRLSGSEIKTVVSTEMWDLDIFSGKSAITSDWCTYIEVSMVNEQAKCW